MTTQEREAQIQANEAAEKRVLDFLRQDFGLNLSRLQWIQKLSAKESRRLVPWVSSVVGAEPNAFARHMLYYVILNAAIGEDQVSAIGLNLLRSEREPECRHVLERAVSTSKDQATRRDFIEELLARPLLIGREGIVFLAVAAGATGEILSRARVVFDEGAFDLESLAVIADTHEREYNLLAEAPPHGSKRLTGAECTAVLHHQVDESSYVLRRAELVPYFGVVLQTDPIRNEDRLAAALGLMKDNGFRGDRKLVAAACQGVFVHAKPLIIETSDTGSRAIVLVRRKVGAKIPTEQVCLVAAPPPRADNLLPKRLLPPDHPARLARPEV